MKNKEKFYTIVFLTAVLLGCTDTTSIKHSELDEVIIFLKQNYPDFELMDSTFIPNFTSSYPEVTQLFNDGIDMGHPFIFTYDLNQDGINEYAASIFTVYEYERVSERYDSVFESRSVLIFGSREGFEEEPVEIR